MGLERTIELDGVHVIHAVGEVAREDAEPGADLEDHVGVLELGEPPDHAEDVLVREEVLAELAVGNDRKTGAHGRENAAAAFDSICASSSRGSSPRARASASTV